MAGNGNGNGVSTMWRVIGGLCLAFVLGGVGLFAQSSAAAARVTSMEQRLDRRDAVDLEFRREIKTDLAEIRGLIQRGLIDPKASSGGGSGR